MSAELTLPSESLPMVLEKRDDAVEPVDTLRDSCGNEVRTAGEGEVDGDGDLRWKEGCSPSSGVVAMVCVCVQCVRALVRSCVCVLFDLLLVEWQRLNGKVESLLVPCSAVCRVRCRVQYCSNANQGPVLMFLTRGPTIPSAAVNERRWLPWTPAIV